MKIKVFLSCILFVQPLCAEFNTLSDLVTYAQAYTEAPESDTNEWLDPTYVGFYESVVKPSFFTRIARKIKKFFGFSVTPAWDPHQFAKLLQNVTKRRLAKGFAGLFDQKIERRQGHKVMVWGDIHGAYHSLVRDLLELKKNGMINENLVITAKGIDFVFVGDLISRSPYSLETLHLVLLLMSKNPEKVFYLRGNHERKTHWEGFSTRRALKHRLSGWRSSAFQAVPLVSEINLFFSTLPDALIVQHQDGKEEMGIMHSPPDEHEMLDMKLKLLLHGEQRIGVVQETKGLKFIGYAGHIAQWSLLSCPIEIYQKFFNFYYDSFVEVSIGPSISESVLTLHNRDARTKEAFHHVHYNPVFGYKLREKKNNIKNKTIVTVGSTVSLSGIVGPLGREVKSGLEAAIYNFNKEENNVLIKPVFFDDAYIPRQAYKNVKRLHETYKIDLILSPIGTPTLSFYLDMVQSGTLAVLFPYTGGTQFRNAGLSNMVHFRASYVQEVEHMLAYLIKKYGVKKFAFFYQDDEYGAPIAQAAHKYLQKHGITTWLDLPHVRTKTDFSEQIKQIKKFAPESIGCFSSHFPTIELIAQLGTDYFLQRVPFGVSFLYSDAFRAFVKERGIPFVFSSVVPIDGVGRLAIVQEHERAMHELGRYASVNSLEAYISASLFIDAVQHVTLPVTKEKIIEYIQGLKNYSFRGITLNFDQQMRQLFDKVWVKTLEGKWVKA